MTTDKELREWQEYRDNVGGLSDARYQAEWLRDRAAVRALVEALPRCDGERDVMNDPDLLYRAPLSLCADPATHTDGNRGDVYFCDRHAAGTLYELAYAPALRALLERMRGWQ